MKKTVFCLILVFSILLCSSAFADLNATVAVGTVSGDYLVCTDGSLLGLEDGYLEFQSLLEGRLFAALTDEGRWILLDDKGERVGADDWEEIWAEDGEVFFSASGRAGVLNADGSTRIEARFTQIVPNGDGGFLTLTGDPYDATPDGVYFVNPDGAEEATGVRVLYGLGDFSEGLMPVTGSENSRMGYLGSRGEWVIRPQFDYAGAFSGGTAEASIESGSGLIDESGNWLVTPRYEVLEKSPVAGGPLLAQNDVSEAVLLDPLTFEIIKTYRSDEVYFSAYYDNGLALLYLSDSTLVIDAHGAVLLDLAVNAVVDTWKSMGERAIVQTGEWGEECFRLYDFTGRIVSGPWQEIESLGLDQNGIGLFACVSFSVSEEIDLRLAWRTLHEIDGTRQIRVVDENGAERLSARNAQAVERLPGGWLIISNDELQVLDDSDEVLCSKSLG